MRRCEAILKIVSELDTDIFCFQETLPVFAREISEQQWIRDRYFLSDPNGIRSYPYAVFMGTKIPPSRSFQQKLDSVMSRKLLVADMKIAEGDIRIGTVHLESLSQNAHYRKSQLDSIFPVLKEAETSFFCGISLTPFANLD